MRFLSGMAVKVTLVSVCLLNTSVQAQASTGGSSITPTSNGGSASTFVTSTASPQASNTETVYVSPVVTGKGSQSTDLASSSTKASESAGVTSAESSTTLTTSTTPTTPTTSSSSTLSTSSTLVTSTVATTASSSSTKDQTSSTLSTSSVLSTTSAAATSSSSSAKATATGSSSGSATKKTGTCTDEGEFNCVGSNYQQCASGAWTAMQALPAGTTCQQGLSEGLWSGSSRRGVDSEMVRKARRTRKGRSTK